MRSYAAQVTYGITREALSNNSDAILRRVEAGETFVITDGGAPVAELRPISRPRFASRDQIRLAFATAPSVDAEMFRRDLELPGDQVEPPEL
jgi:antitoxin (DNA-binding transcriptional repressor) of toxin-antitoxin stability system